jgi:hypothetical protein
MPTKNNYTYIYAYYEVHLHLRDTSATTRYIIDDVKLHLLGTPYKYDKYDPTTLSPLPMIYWYN